MTPEHSSQLSMVKALRELGASYVRVGDVECRFDLSLTPLKPTAHDDAVMAETAEIRLARRLRELEKELGISQT